MVKEQFQNQMNIPADGIVGSNDVVYPVYTQQQQQQQQQQQYNSGLLVNQATDGNDLLSGNGNNGGGIYLDNDDNNIGLMLKELRIHQNYNDNYGINISNVDSMLMQSNLIPAVQGYPLQQEMEISHDYDEIPFDTIADDRQSYIESKEACDSRYVNYSRSLTSSQIRSSSIAYFHGFSSSNFIFISK